MSKNETASFKVRETRVDNFTAAVAALQRGEVIVYPTETLYGLGADALNCAAVEKVFQLKGRDPNNPLPVLVAERNMLNALVTEVSPLAEKLIARFWPGPLTIVLPARHDIPAPLVNSTGGVGVRISSQIIATELVRTLGRPLTATSANPSGKAPARTMREAESYFDAIEIFIDAGELPSKTGSSVIEFHGEKIKIIRDGDIKQAELQEIVGEDAILP